MNNIIENKEINKEALDLNSSDLKIQKKYTFKLDNNSFSIFKKEDEDYIKVFLKALTYSIYKPLYNKIEIDPPLYKRYKADLICMDYSNEPIFWSQVFERDFEKIEYLCRHLSLEEFILVEINDNIYDYINTLKSKIHYKYHHLIKVLNFVPEIIYYIDNNDILVLNDWYNLIDLS